MRRYRGRSTVAAVPSTTPAPTLRVVIVDDHPISRCAYGALLRSEGVKVLAELAADEAVLALLRTLRPDLVIVDVRPGHEDGVDVARQAGSLGQAVVLTSSARVESFGTALNGFGFIAKADICRAALVEMLTSRWRHAGLSDG